MNEDTTNPNGPAKPANPFRMPSRQEMEERRRQLEANSKPALHFKPKGITLDKDNANPAQSTANATSSESLFDGSSDNLNDTRTALNGTTQNFGGVTSATPIIMSSRQHYQQQQQHQQQQKQELNQKPAQSNPVSLDDDFGFDDDLGDIILDDDLFDIEDPPSKPQETTTAAQSSTLGSGSGISATGTGNGTKVDSAAAVVVPPPFIPKSKTTIVVKSSQRGNPLLQFIRNVPYEYGDIVPDFVVGLTSCIIFLSIRYHRLHPEYIFSRIAALGKSFVLRVLLILVDVDTHQQAIRELTRVALVNDFTVICAWSNEEAARYIETYKAYENKAPDAIKERVDNDYLSKLTDSLTQIQSVNKTDVITLSSTFGSFKNIMNASAEDLAILPGFGERKLKRLMEAFDQPFAIDPKKRRQRRG